jgi:hypothetical protein
MRRTLTTLAVGVSAALAATLVVVAVPAEGAPNGGGPGDPLLLSRVNQAGPMTVLKTNGGFRILAKDPKRPPLMVYTPDSMPPLQVSSKAKVENLNADLLDGVDSSVFVRKSDLAMPMAAFVEDSGHYWRVSEETVVLSVSLTPSAEGTVIVTSSIQPVQTESNGGALCAITTETVIEGPMQAWQVGGDITETMVAQLAGTRGFAVEGGTPFTANLVCKNINPPRETIFFEPSLTAIFIPNP